MQRHHRQLIVDLVTGSRVLAQGSRGVVENVPRLGEQTDPLVELGSDDRGTADVLPRRAFARAVQ